MASEREGECLRIFEEALAQDESHRKEWVTARCAGDSALQVRIEELLALHDAEEPFLEIAPAGDVLASDIDPLQALLRARPELDRLLTSIQGDASAHCDATREDPTGTADAIDVRTIRDVTACESRYAGREEIGRGGMGVVFKVWDETLRRALAMKVARSRQRGSAGSSERASLARFLEEARITARLDHPGVVPLHDMGVDRAGRIFFTMRLVEGRDLSTTLDLANKGVDGWTPHRVLEVLARVCDTLAYAHSRGIIHRDLKPSNIMVGRYGEIYVMDWGLAKSIGRPDHRDLRIASDADESTMDAADNAPLLTFDGAVVGTPAFMSPEQAEGSSEHVDARSDIYAVGAMLYTVLAGQVPYASSHSSRSPRSTLAALRRGPPDPLADSVPDELAAICTKAMARDPDARYASMEDLANDLRAYREGHVVRAHRTDRRTAFKKWVRRNPALSGAIAVALTALVVGLVISLSLLSEVRGERDAKSAALTLLQTETAEKLRALKQEEEATTAKNAALKLVQEETAAKATALAERETALKRAESERLVAKSRDIMSTDPGSALLLSIAALENDDNHRARTAAVAALGALREVQTIIGHDVEVTGVAFLDGGKRVVTSALDFTVRLWDWQRGEELLRLSDLRHGATRLVVHPSGERFSCSSTLVARIWDSATGRPLHVFRHGSTDILDVAFDPTDRALLATAAADGKARIWRLGAKQAQEFTGHEGRVLDVEFAPRGDRLGTAGEDGTARIWSTDDGAQQIVLSGHTGAVYRVAFHPQGATVVTRSADGTARTWNAQTGALIAELAGHEGGVTCTEYSPNGDLLVTAGAGGRAHVWDSQSGAVKTNFAGHTGAIRSISFRPGGMGAAELVVLTASEDGTARLWDAGTGLEIDVLYGHTSGIVASAWSDDGTRIVTGSKDGTTRVWTPRLDIVSGAKTDWPLGAKISPDYSRVAVPTRKGRVELRETATGRLVKELRAKDAPIAKVFFDRGGERLAGTTAEKGTVYIWDIVSGELSLTLKGHAGTVEDIAFSADGRLIVTGSTDGLARVWKAKSGSIVQTFKGHTPPVSAVDIDAGRNRIATTSSVEKNACTWELSSGRRLDQFRHADGWLYHVALDPLGELLLSASKLNTMFVWRIGSSAPAIELRGHTFDVDRAIFESRQRPDGSRFLATLHTDGSANVWKLEPYKRNSTLLYSIHPPNDERFVSGAFLPDADEFESVSSVGRRQRWPLRVREAAMARRPRIPTASDLRAAEIGSDADRERLQLAENRRDLRSVINAARRLERTASAGSAAYKGIGLQIERSARYFEAAGSDKLSKPEQDGWLQLELAALEFLERAARAPGADPGTVSTYQRRIAWLRKRLSPSLPTLATIDAAVDAESDVRTAAAGLAPSVFEDAGDVELLNRYLEARLDQRDGRHEQAIDKLQTLLDDNSERRQTDSDLRRLHHCIRLTCRLAESLRAVDRHADADNVLVDMLRPLKLPAEIYATRLEVASINAVAKSDASLLDYAHTAVWTNQLRELKGPMAHRPALLASLACYRMQLYTLAEHALQLMRWAYQQTNGRVHPTATATLAMTLWQLGRQEEAKRIFADLSDPAKIKPFQRNVFLDEAAALLDSTIASESFRSDVPDAVTDSSN